MKNAVQGLPAGESAQRNAVCDALTTALLYCGDLAYHANERTTIDLRDEGHVRALARLLTTRDPGGRDGSLGENTQTLWRSVAAALSSPAEALEALEVARKGRRAIESYTLPLNEAKWIVEEVWRRPSEHLADLSTELHATVHARIGFRPSAREVASICATADEHRPVAPGSDPRSSSSPERTEAHLTDEQRCGAIAPSVWICTLAKGHEGDHRAHCTEDNSDEPAVVWPSVVVPLGTETREPLKSCPRLGACFSDNCTCHPPAASPSSSRESPR